MTAGQKPLSWLTIIIALVVTAVATGLGVGALGYLVVLPSWFPTAALGAVVGVVAAFLISRRNAQH